MSIKEDIIDFLDKKGSVCYTYTIGYGYNTMYGKCMKENKKKILLSLKKARGNIEHIEEMVESGGECFSVIQQTLATIGLLESANDRMLEEHIEKTLKEVFGEKSPEAREGLKEEIARVIRSSRK